MAITVAQFHTHLDTAKTAIGNGDFETAKSELLQAMTVLTGLPDGEAGENQTVAWRDQISKLLDFVKTELSTTNQSSLGMVQRQKLAIKQAEASTVL